ncbi:hypothetical protein ACWC9T_37840 [Kitasatospora sp. NPDC001159]
MMVRQLKRLVGRRTTLRYLAIGAVASIVSACSGNGSGGGVRGQAFKAFVIGDWQYQSTAEHKGVIAVTPDGKWSATNVAGLKGRWELNDARLIVHLDWIDPQKKEPCVVPSVPDGVDEGFTGRFPMDNGWSKNLGTATEVSYRNGELTLHFPSYEDVEGAGLTVTCTRRK